MAPRSGARAWPAQCVRADSRVPPPRLGHFRGPGRLRRADTPLAVTSPFYPPLQFSVPPLPLPPLLPLLPLFPLLLLSPPPIDPHWCLARLAWFEPPTGVLLIASAPR